MDLRKVKKLIELVTESGIAELEVSSGDESVRIAMNMNNPTSQRPIVTSVPTQSPSPVPTNQATERTLIAPMSGTFYCSPSPEAEPYIEVGSQVNVGDVVGIIESMKMMHEVRAQKAGVVVNLPVANGVPVTTAEVIAVLS